ncbi:probable serine carboxypeptidase CPVL [Halichondria panicea]|uniref:probable serine carboxypeptidase CPVL n=1 Tax=Halichondria panicea TaxID=6063 RepID=UPI00312B9C65
MMAYADLVFQFGMADENQATYIYSRTNTAVQYIKAEWFYDGFKIFAALLNGDLIPYPTYLCNITGSTNYYNILRTSLCTRLVWKIGDDVAGYVSCMVVVRGGGHILPFDQPERALNLIQNFVNMQ